MALSSSGISKLWNSYEAARKADRPEDEKAVLKQIKAAAKKDGLVWDYYQACEKYVEAGSRKNWKLYQSLSEERDSEIKALGESVAWFYHKKLDLRYAKANEKQLIGASHKEFWENDYRISQYSFSQALCASFENDWDYACFSLVSGDGSAAEGFEGRYPLAELAEFIRADSKEMPAYAKKYEGKAVSLLAREMMLQERLYAENKDSRYYQELKADCGTFEKERKAFTSGIDRKIAESIKGVVNILEVLESKDIQCSVKDGKAFVVFRNLSSARIALSKEGKEVWTSTVRNPIGSLYATDTASVSIPEMPDGEYEIEATSGKYSSQGTYSRFTISLATRRNADGTGIYAADYLSGDPLSKAEIELRDRAGKVISSVETALSDGFTPLPESIIKAAEGGKNLSVSVRSGSRSSKTASLLSPLYSEQDLTDNRDRHCILLTDRAAYNPDETLHFKAIVYEGKYSVKAAQAISLKATAYNAEGDIIETKDLKTNGWGSADGSFILKRCKRGGTYNIMIEDGREVLASKTVVVDDYILPTFDVVFDQMPDALERPVESIEFKGRAAAYSGHGLGNAKVVYTISRNGEVSSEQVLPLGYDGGFRVSVPVPKTDPEPWFEYYILGVRITDGTGETHEFSKGIAVRRKSEEPAKPVEYFFEDMDIREGLGVRIVSAPGRNTWAVAELYGCGNILLEKKLIPFTGETSVSFAHKASYPESIRLNVLFFQNKKAHSHSVSRSRENHSLDLGFEFTRFLDSTVPGASYTFTARTAPGVECAITVFDKSTETVRPNEWNRLEAILYPKPSVSFRTVPGTNDSDHRYGIMMTKTLTRNAMVQAEEAVPFQLVEEKPSFDANGAGPTPGEGYIRENFANTIAWEPSLKSDENGNVTFSFKNADKLSTYYVQVFAHDRSMRNGVLRKEMKVTVPVKISLVETAFLHTGDRLVLNAQVSNSLDRAVSGKVIFDDGSSVPVNVEPFGTAVAKWTLIPQKEGDIPVTVIFRADDRSFGSDGIKVIIPARKPVLELTEAHSALFKYGEDKDALIARLRSEFVNIPGSEATMREISIMEMVEEAIPENIQPRSENTIDLAMAAKARRLLGMDRRDLILKISSRRGADGGYSWMDGMDQSPVVTSLLLELLGDEMPALEEAVRYIDKAYARGRTTPRWAQWITTSEYFYVRSLYPGVKFDEKLTKERKKEMRDYLCPKNERGLEGMVFAKARRALTLGNLLGSGDGPSFVKKCGLGLFARLRMSKSAAADRASLRQYAVSHPSGGIYFPNAVMPFRGLLESELYAHVILARLFEGTEIADGIRLWTMVQKETQKWGSDPAYIEALELVREGSETLKKTSVIALKGSFEKPYGEILASGNGMSLSSGMSHTLRTGDKVKVRTVVSNEENRSFVKVTVPFPAGLVPVDQLSGYSRWRCYRSVQKDRIEYWFDVLPEEKTTLEDEFYATREGSFQTAPASVECLYAGHYHANTGPVPETVVE